MLLTELYYDDKGRLQESIAQNHIGGYDRTINAYNFNNQVVGTTRTHSSSTVGSLTIANTYVYDNMGRKVQTTEQINGGQQVTISQLTFNDVGQLLTKNLGTGLQNISYAYNERGWMKNITAPLFAMQLNYNDGTTPQWNGNISNQLWGTPGNLTKSYTYSYDNLNRLVAGNSNEGYNENNISYDPLGNIQSLARQGSTYGYSYIGNQLQSINGLTSGTYAYDANGNTTFDARIGKSINYNYLNLPQALTTTNFNLTYTYDAGGQKLRKSFNSTNTDYISGIQYTNGNIDYIQTEEGRAINSGNGNYTYEYYIGDNLGNSRIRFDQTGAAKQQDDYYPFGLEITRGTTTSPKNEYLYNRKELQEETGFYDYGSRFLDPYTGRWNVVDQLADHPNQIDKSPYAYAWNNPVKLKDPDGNCPLCLIALEVIAEATGTELLGGAVFVGGATAVTLGTMHHVGMNVSAPRDATFVNNGSLHERLAIINNSPDREKSPPNPNGSKGKPDHQEKVKDLEKQAQSELKPGEQVLTEKKLRGHDSNRRPDVQILDKDNKAKKVYEAERKPNSSRNQKREAEYNKLGIDHETHKVGN